MPYYDYYCDTCKIDYELYAGTPAVCYCPECRAALRRVWKSAPPVHYHCDGVYAAERRRDQFKRGKI